MATFHSNKSKLLTMQIKTDLQIMLIQLLRLTISSLTMDKSSNPKEENL